mgnify:CR=1 FL=1
MFKKGQAAMEFLMTYGWAILVVLIAIGALAYFGVLNPSRFLPNSCTISNQFACESGDFVAYSNGTVTLIIRNGRGVDTNIIQFAVNYTNSAGIASNCNSGTTGWNVTDGQKQAITPGTCSSIGTKGGKFKGDIILYYADAGSSLGVRQSTGSIVTKLE